MLKIENLTLKRGYKRILKNITFEVKDKEIYGILGSNGAGKSSLAYTIMGCNSYKQDKGKIIFDGQDITDLSIWQRARLGITLAWQEGARFEGITVEDYILLGMKNKNQIEVEQALQKVLLSPKEYLKRKLDKNLSGGERKRIEIAAIFAMKPKLVILDEPDSGIDILALNKIIDLIYEIKKRGATIILITHRTDVAKIAERSAIIGEGYLIREGATKNIIKYFEDRCFNCSKFR
jgi:Fe-S cluster assembly ATP-binding protein